MFLNRLKRKKLRLCALLCLSYPILCAQSISEDNSAKSALNALAEAEKARLFENSANTQTNTQEKCEGDCALQTQFNEEAVLLGVDPLSLITVTPGGPPVRIPIAIPDTLALGADTSRELAQTLIQVIRNDLTMSGLFEIMPPETYALVNTAKEGIVPSTIQFDAWYNIGASVLIKTHYSQEGGHDNFGFSVFNVDAASNLPFKYENKTLTENNVRAVAHDFANKLIGFYTGTDGVFGSRILFAAQGKSNFRKIQSFDTDGFGLQTYDLPQAINVMPEWGPNGSILFTQLSQKSDNIYVYRKGNETELRQLTDFEGWASGADYCPKNGKIAFTGAREQNGNIYVMNSDGSELVQLTDMPDSIQTSPSWSPDCSQLAFVSNYSGKPQIYVINADGSGMRRLTWVGNYNTTPDWSPKGDLIAFTARDERNVFDIFTIHVKSGEVTRLTQDQGHNREPSWSPDGRYLVFESTRDGKQPRLYLMNSDGRWQTRISATPGLKTPTWKN